MYSIFYTILLIDKGKSLIPESWLNSGVHQIHPEPHIDATFSTKADIELSDLLAYITTTKLGDGSWEVSSESFIIHCKDQIRRYVTLT